MSELQQPRQGGVLKVTDEMWEPTRDALGYEFAGFLDAHAIDPSEAATPVLLAALRASKSLVLRWTFGGKEL